MVNPWQVMPIVGKPGEILLFFDRNLRRSGAAESVLTRGRDVRFIGRDSGAGLEEIDGEGICLAGRSRGQAGELRSPVGCCLLPDGGRRSEYRNHHRRRQRDGDRHARDAGDGAGRDPSRPGGYRQADQIRPADALSRGAVERRSSPAARPTISSKSAASRTSRARSNASRGSSARSNPCLA
jgi:hypothetical protein